MSEQESFPNSVHRVSAKDRKAELSSGGLQFPTDDELPELPSEAERFPPLPPEPRRRGPGEAVPVMETLPTPMTESEARFPFLAKLPVEAAPLPFDEFENVPSIYTPPEERFPPLPSAEPVVEAVESRRDVAEPDFIGDLPAPVSKRKRSGGGAWQNAVAVVFLLAAIAVFAVGMMIFFNPYGPLNPFPPATPPPVYVTATFSAALPPGVTATFTPLPVEMLTEMAPARSEAQSADAGATAIPATPAAKVTIVGGG